MNTQQLTTSLFYVLLVIGGLFCCMLMYFFIDAPHYRERIYRNTTFIDIDVSGMNQEEFFQQVAILESDLEEKKIFLNTEPAITVRAVDIGIGFDEEQLWKTLYDYDERNSLLKEMQYWGRSFVTERDIDTTALASSKKLQEAIAIWKPSIKEEDPFEGDISIAGISSVVRLPRPGYVLDIETLTHLVTYTLIHEPNEVAIDIPYRLVEPVRNAEDLYRMQRELDRIISLPIQLYTKKYDEHTLDLSIKDIASLLRISLPEDPKEDLVIDINDEVLIEKLSPLYPKEARFFISEDGQTMQVLPSQSGFDIDVNKTGENILRVKADSTQRRVPFEFTRYLLPTFTTQEAEALGIKHLVSSFTTYHSCCVSRVDNIHLVADILDGKILKPGETLAMNEFLGERTEERGFKSAGTIIEGRLEDTIGGGISQFITTLHNAVYWGGFEVVEHKTHTLYFSRYPLGIEATINWPYVDYVFRNDTDSGMYIDTSYTDTSITIRIYGENDGRSVTGEHHASSGTSFTIVEGEDTARKVVSTVSKRYNFRKPQIEFIPDTSIPRGEQIIESPGEESFSVNVIRSVLQNDQLLHYDIWPVHYLQDSMMIRKHPCDFYDAAFDYTQCS